jgi:predicted NUDIX family phosphoesterase
MTNQDTPKTERVLVIPRAAFEAHGQFNGFKDLVGETDLGDYLETGGPGTFMERESAETSPSFKQIVPYISIICEDSVFSYRRGTGTSEDRLHDVISLGVGGHVNDQDDPDEPFFAFLRGTIRELLEEVGVEINEDNVQQSVVGLLNDDESEVGKVHLGVFMIIQVNKEMALKICKDCEHTMENPQFVPIIDLETPELYSQLEGWSQTIAKKLIADISQGGKWDEPAFRERVGMLAICAANLASAASAFTMQDTPRSHLDTKAMVESAAGEVQCMLAGLSKNQDIESHLVKKAGKEFMDKIQSFLKHQGTKP